MEKDSDFSDSEYDHYVKTTMDLMKENEVWFKFIIKNDIDQEDFENSAVLELAEQVMFLI